MMAIEIKLNWVVDPVDLGNLREAVGWERFDQDYPAVFDGYWSTISAVDPVGHLIGWCAILSDGVRHAVLIDVMVHPILQRQGIGRRIVKRAVEYIKSQGINIIHVDFLPEHTRFYETCGFRVGLGGICKG